MLFFECQVQFGRKGITGDDGKVLDLSIVSKQRERLTANRVMVDVAVILAIRL